MYKNFVRNCVFYLSLLFVVVGCRSENHKINRDHSDLKTIAINLEDQSKILFSDIMMLPTFLKLETRKDILIGNIDKILFQDKKIFIADKFIAETVFIFDENGKFLNKVGKKGQAPGEFSEIRDIAIDSISKRIAILDLKGRKILFYNYQGEYLDSERMPFLFSAFSFIDSETLVFSTSTSNNDHRKDISNYYLLVGNIKGKTKYRYFGYNDNQYNFTYFNSEPLRKFGSNLYFYPRYCDTIYKIAKDKVSAAYFIDFGEKGIPEDKRHIESDNQFLEYSKRYYMFDGDFIDLENGACFVINTPKANYNVFYSKKSKVTYTSKQLLLNNPLYNFMKVPIGRSAKNTIVTYYKAAELLSYKTFFDNKSIDGSKKTKLIFNNLSDNDNPVLFFYKLKEF